MRTEFIPVQVPSSVAAGTPVRASSLREKAIQISGNLVGSIDIEITLHEAAGWFKHGSSITAAGVVQIPIVCESVRIRTTAYTSGTFEAWLGGFNSRTDV